MKGCKKDSYTPISCCQLRPIRASDERAWPMRGQETGRDWCRPRRQHSVLHHVTKTRSWSSDRDRIQETFLCFSVLKIGSTLYLFLAATGDLGRKFNLCPLSLRLSILSLSDWDQPKYGSYWFCTFLTRDKTHSPTSPMQQNPLLVSWMVPPCWE